MSGTPGARSNIGAYERERFIRTTREAFAVEVFAVDRELRYVLFNEAHERRVSDSSGAAPAEGMVATDLVRDPAARARLFTDLHRALAGESHVATTTGPAGATGAQWSESHYSPVHGPDGGVIGVAVMRRDPTPQLAREAEFRSLETRYESFLRAAADGIVALRRDGTIIECNAAFARLVGKEVAEVLADNWRTWAGPEGQPNFDMVLEASFAREGIFTTVLRHRDGHLIPVEIAASRLGIDGGPAVLYTVRDLSERWKASQMIAESESRLRTIFSHAPIGLGVADLTTGRLVEANAALLALYGRPLDEIRSKPLNEFTHEDDRAREHESLAAVATGAVSDYLLRKRYVRPDGTAVPVEVHGIRLPDALGRHPLVLGIITDLRQLAEAEQALRESEAKYRRLSENALDIIYRYRTGAHPAIEYVNSAVGRLLGISPIECYEDPEILFRRIHPDDTGKLAKHLAGSDGEETHLLRWTHRDGSIVWLEHRNNLLRDANGTLIAIEGIAREVTAKVAQEERLRLFGRVVEQAGEVVMITDRGGRIQQVNRAFELVTGYRRDEVLGLNPRLLKSGEQDQDFYVRMWSTLRAGETFTATIKNRRKDGELYDAEMMVTPVRDPEGTVTHYVGLQRDVTKERLRDEQLRQAQKMEAMGQVTGGIAHDFNNLLTVVLANADLLALELTPGSDGAQCLEELVHAARHGSTLVRQLLAFGRREILRPVPTDLRHTVTAFADVLRRILPETIVLHPVDGTAHHAFADQGSVEQMLLNLATNARDAMPDGGELWITVGETERALAGAGTPPVRYSTLAVRDSGTGMSEETRRRAFEPFYTTKPTGKGTGLGLPMVFGTMEQLGGWVEVESAPGAGTTITLGFARASGAERRDTPLPPPRPATAGLPRTVLLVEDNVALRRVARRSLENAGCRVFVAADGEEGFRVWEAHRAEIDLLVTDAVMPLCGGPDLIRRIRRAGGACEMVLASGYASEDFADLEGDLTILPKPWTRQELLAVVGKAPDVPAA